MNVFIVFFVILPSSYDLENVTSCSVSQSVHRTPRALGEYDLAVDT